VRKIGVGWLLGLNVEQQHIINVEFNSNKEEKSETKSKTHSKVFSLSVCDV
jgi:outer membrane protein assembly factor BamE (lipoprotein component of BamABCDE complex)